MGKQHEILYPEALGEAGRAHALTKPFSDSGCGRYLREIGTVLELLPPPPARLLDLGAGTAWTSALFARRGYDVTAQDISPGMIALAKRQNFERHSPGVLRLLVQDYEQMNYDREFDCVVFFDSLHHAEDERAALNAAFRALKADAVCITVEPGSGHGNARSSRLAAAQYGVTEKDMPPQRIIEIAQSLGFRKFEVFHRRQSPLLLAAGTPGESLPSPRRLELALRYFTSGLRCLFYGTRMRDSEALGLIPATTFRHHNFVRLTK